MSARPLRSPPSRPLVSVVVAVYNLELYIERCLESLAAQTLSRLEVLVVNDGSTDESQQVIDECVQRHPHLFRTFHKPNGGYGSACNLGIEQARGEYLMLVDGDDFLDPDTCEFMAGKAQQTGADLVMGNLRYLKGDGIERFVPISIRGEKMLDQAERRRLFLGWATPCGRLYRKALFDDPSFRFLPGILFADVNFSPKSYLLASRIFYVEREVYNYDVTRPTQSMKQTDRRVLEVIPALRQMLQFYQEHGQFEAYREELLEYTARHCFSWIGRVEGLPEAERADALASVFAVADDFFGDQWLSSRELRLMAGRRRTLLIRAARLLGYRPITWSWQMRKLNRALDTKVEQALKRSLQRYRWARGQLDRQLFDRLSL